MFQTTFGTSRLYLLVYGKAKVGKTRSFLDVVKDHGHYMVLVSTDRGLLYVDTNSQAFEGKLAVAYPRDLKDIRKALAEGRKRVERLMKKGVAPERIWFVIDNISHLQQRLMKEARKVQVEGNSKSGRGQIQDSYEREMTTDVDYGVNLGHMVEIADELDTLPCNVGVIALEKDQYVGDGRDRKASGKQIVAMSGQPANRFAGDADAILQMCRDKKGVAYFAIHGTGSGGDRSGNLEKVEPADLTYIASKMRGRDVNLDVEPEAPAPSNGASTATAEEAPTESTVDAPASA